MILDDLGSWYRWWWWCPLSQRTARMPATWATRVAAPLEGFQQLPRENDCRCGDTTGSLELFIKQNWFTMIYPSYCSREHGFRQDISRGTLKPSRLDAEDLHQASKTTTRPSLQVPSKCSEHVGTNSRKTDYVSPGLEIPSLFDGLYTWYDRVLSFEQKMGGQLVGAHQPTTWDLQFQNFPVMFGYAYPAYSLRCLSQPSKSIPFKPTLSHWLSG